MGPRYKGTVMPAWANNGYGTRSPETLDSKLDAWTHKRPKLDAWTHRRTPYQPCWKNDGVCRQFVTGKKSPSNDNGMKSKLTNRSQYSGGWRGETPCSSQGAAAHGHDDRQVNVAVRQTDAVLHAPKQLDIELRCLAICRHKNTSNERLHIIKPLLHEVAMIVEPTQHPCHSIFRPTMAGLCNKLEWVLGCSWFGSSLGAPLAAS